MFRPVRSSARNRVCRCWSLRLLRLRRIILLQHPSRIVAPLTLLHTMLRCYFLAVSWVEFNESTVSLYPSTNAECCSRACERINNPLSGSCCKSDSSFHKRFVQLGRVPRTALTRISRNSWKIENVSRYSPTWISSLVASFLSFRFHTDVIRI